MFGKIRHFTLPHFVGLLFILVGWLLTAAKALLNPVILGAQSGEGHFSYAGLVLIIIGAYLPETWDYIRDRRERRRTLVTGDT
jgi:hypothetical protein